MISSSSQWTKTDRGVARLPLPSKPIDQAIEAEAVPYPTKPPPIPFSHTQYGCQQQCSACDSQVLSSKHRIVASRGSSGALLTHVEQVEQSCVTPTDGEIVRDITIKERDDNGRQVDEDQAVFICPEPGCGRRVIEDPYSCFVCRTCHRVACMRHVAPESAMTSIQSGQNRSIARATCQDCAAKELRAWFCNSAARIVVVVLLLGWCASWIRRGCQRMSDPWLEIHRSRYHR